MVHTCTQTMKHSVCIPTYLLLARIVIIDKQVNISKIVNCTVLSLDYDLILFLYFYTEDNHKSKTLPSIFSSYRVDVSPLYCFNLISYINLHSNSSPCHPSIDPFVHSSFVHPIIVMVISFLSSVRCRCCIILCVVLVSLLHIFCSSSDKMGGFFFTLNK